MILRKLLPSDVGAYRALKAEAIKLNPSAFTLSLEEQLNAPDSHLLADIAPAQKGCVIGAFDGSDLLGVAGLRPGLRQQAAHRVTLFGMAVRPADHRKGIGRALVHAVLMEAQSLRFLQVVLTYSDGNVAAERLYSSCGFIEFGREPRAVIVEGADIAKVYMLRTLDTR